MVASWQELLIFWGSRLHLNGANIVHCTDFSELNVLLNDVFFQQWFSLMDGPKYPCVFSLYHWWISVTGVLKWGQVVRNISRMGYWSQSIDTAELTTLIYILVIMVIGMVLQVWCVWLDLNLEIFRRIIVSLCCYISRLQARPFFALIFLISEHYFFGCLFTCHRVLLHNLLIRFKECFRFGITLSPTENSIVPNFCLILVRQVRV